MKRRRQSEDPTRGTPARAAWPEKVVGGKHVRLLERLLSELRDDQAHGNRRLFLDDVFVAHLLAFFNPAIRSLRTLEDFSQTEQARRHLSTPKLCRSTLSDFHRLADPGRLRPMLDALRAELGRRRAGGVGPDDGLGDLLRRALAVDGTFLPACAQVAWAVRSGKGPDGGRHRARLDFEVAVGDGLPEVVAVPEPGQSEADAAIGRIEAGQVRLYDRGYDSFALIDAHYDDRPGGPTPRAHFVIRFRPPGRNTPALAEASDRPLGPEDHAAGVVSDRVGAFHASRRAKHQVRDVPLREVVVKRVEDGVTTTIRLITNLLDVPAAAVAELYRHRWRVELFFRWLKCFGHFAHLMSHSASGVLMQFYVAVIAAMLVSLQTGCRPSKYLFTLLSQVAAGAATAEEILPILRERERQSEVARRSAAARRPRNRG